MSRPSPFLGGAAIVSVLLGVGAACMIVTQPESMAIIERPMEKAAASDARGEPPKLRSYPAREGRLASPFLPEHPTREQAKRRTAASNIPAPPAREIGRVPRIPHAPTKPKAIRLVGIVSSAEGRRAILSVGGRHVLLSEGETKDGVTLLALTEREATISSEDGEITLQVGA